MKVRVVKCARCGSAITARGGSQTARCSHCGTVVVVPGAGRRGGSSTAVLRPGMKAQWMGKEWELTGRVRLSMSELGETYTWDEYQLLTPDGECMTLEHDEGKWKVMWPFVPTTPIGPQQAANLNEGDQLSLDGSTATISDRAVATVREVEGELTFRARVGDTVHYLDAHTWNVPYSVEWSEDAIEFYKGRHLGEREVYRAFGMTAELSALDRAERQRGSQLLFASICLLFGLAAMLGWGVALSGGKEVARGAAQINSIGPEGVRLGPITLDPGLRVHRLSLRGSMVEASAWVAAVLETADGTELLAAQGDLWDESGRDSDGPWHESALSTETDFLVTRPGPYYLRLYAEKDTPTGTFNQVEYAIYGGVLYPPYLLAYGIVALVTSLIVFAWSNRANLAKLAESSDDDD